MNPPSETTPPSQDGPAAANPRIEFRNVWFAYRDQDWVLRDVSFSIEPGVYFPNSLGLRTEIDVIIDYDGSVKVPSSPLQSSVLPLLAEDWTQ